MTELRYRADVRVDDLAIGECTIHSASDGRHRWWHLVFLVAREDNGQPEFLRVPVIPGGAFDEHGPGGRSWGLTSLGGGAWQVSPSIDFGGVWHQTPKIVGVPTGERWATGAAP
jgi:hypothetical protein